MIQTIDYEMHAIYFQLHRECIRRKERNKKTTDTRTQNQQTFSFL